VVNRQVVAYKNYFLDFYGGLNDNVQRKIEWTLNLIRVTPQIPENILNILKKLKDCTRFGLKLAATSIEFSPSSTKET